MDFAINLNELANCSRLVNYQEPWASSAMNSVFPGAFSSLQSSVLAAHAIWTPNQSRHRLTISYNVEPILPPVAPQTPHLRKASPTHLAITFWTLLAYSVGFTASSGLG